MKKVLLGLGMALVLALGGVGVANLAAGADHSGHPGSGRQPAPATADHGKPDAPGQQASENGSEHSAQMRDLAQTHKDGMRAWQKCHQAGGANCVKPAPPGWLKHPDQHPGGWPPKHEKADRADKGEKNDDQRERD